jgi:transglutaminase-like putative cysteine protease
MARTAGPSPRVQRLAGFGAMALLAGATGLAFGRVFSGGAVGKVILVALASAAVASALERRNLLLATLVSGVLMVTAVGIFVLPHTTWYGLPTLDTLRAMRDAASLVGEQARVQVAPTPPLVPLLLAAVTAMWAAMFSSHALAFRAGSPLLALLPPVALLTFADTVLEERFRPGYGVLFLLGALAVVFVDGLRRVQRWGPLWAWPGSRHRRLAPATTRGAGRVTVGALVLATFAPLFLPGISSKAVVDLSGSHGDAIRIDPLVSVASALTSGQPRVVFTVKTNHPTYYRMLSLDRFDGIQWTADFEAAGPVPADGFHDTVTGPQIDQTFSIKSTLFAPGVPAASPLASIDLPLDGMSYDPSLDNLYSGVAIDNDTTYTVVTPLVQPDPTVLDRFVLPGDPTAYDRWLQLPSNVPPRVKTLAESWVAEAGATTMFDQVRAIQDHLVGGEYAYDDTVDERDDVDALDTFLFTSKRGFCQQFAPAMATMLRLLGIPTRVAIGFTPGAVLDDRQPDLYTVTTKDAHSWVEVWFGPQFGWLRFEPTPGTGRLDPVAFEYYDAKQVACADGSTTRGCGDPSGDGNESQTPQAPGVSTRNLPFGAGIEGNPGLVDAPRGRGPIRGGGSFLPFPNSARGSPPPYGLIALSALVAILALVPLIPALGRRRRLRKAAPEPRRLILATYDVFSERAAMLGHGREPGETLEEYRIRLSSSGLLQDGHLDRLTTIAGRAAYAAGEPASGDPGEADRAARTTLRDLRKGTGLVQRVVGLYRPSR